MLRDVYMFHTLIMGTYKWKRAGAVAMVFFIDMPIKIIYITSREIAYLYTNDT